MKMIKYMIKNDECNDNQNDKKMKKTILKISNV